MLARMARRASLTLRKRRSSRMDSLGNHYRESMSSVFVEDKLGMTVAWHITCKVNRGRIIFPYGCRIHIILKVPKGWGGRNI